MVIKESGMIFGDYNEERVFYIEKSEQYKRLQDKEVSSVEFVLYRKSGEKLIFIEAKSSSPNPENSSESFEKYIEDISKKFTDAFAIYERVILDKSLRKEFINIDYNKCVISFVLIIKGHKKEWLVPLKDALERKLRSSSILLKLWDIRVLAINDEIAKNKGLIY